MSLETIDWYCPVRPELIETFWALSMVANGKTTFSELPFLKINLSDYRMSQNAPLWHVAATKAEGAKNLFGAITEFANNLNGSTTRFQRLGDFGYSQNKL